MNVELMLCRVLISFTKTVSYILAPLLVILFQTVKNL